MIPRKLRWGYGPSLAVKKCWERETRKTLQSINGQEALLYGVHSHVIPMDVKKEE
jgi:hypothetical protein